VPVSTSERAEALLWSSCEEYELAARSVGSVTGVVPTVRVVYQIPALRHGQHP
jgi:hypothetical protein